MKRSFLLMASSLALCLGNNACSTPNKIESRFPSSQEQDIQKAVADLNSGKIPSQELSRPNPNLKDLQKVLKDLKATRKMGGNSGGGGDDVGLEFESTLGKALDNLKNSDLGSYRALESKKLKQVLKDLTIVSVDDALDVDVKELIQNSVATNYREANLILVNRKRWSAIQQDAIKEGIAIHELASLLNLEQTGKYPISSKYVTLRGASESQLKRDLEVSRIQQLRALNPSDQPYEVLEKFFKEASDIINIKDFESVESAERSGNKTTCAYAASPQRASFFYGKVFLGAGELILSPKVPSNGPLFPEVPAKVEPRLFIAFQYADLLRFGVSNNGNQTWQHLARAYQYPERFFPIVIDWQLPSSLEYQPQEILQKTSGTEKIFVAVKAPTAVTIDDTSAALAKHEIRFRKNNGLITFQIKVQSSEEDLYKRPYPVSKSEVGYGYCYSAQAVK